MTSLENELAKSLMYRVSLTDKEVDAIALAKEIAKDIKPFVREEFEVKNCNNEGNNRRPFNLEEYLANPTKRLITRDGRKVTRILCTDAKGIFPFVALIKKDNDKGEGVCSFTKNGNFCESTETSLDLFFALEKKEGWINLFKINSTITTGKVYNTKEEAKSAVINSAIYISTVKIEWEE